MISAIQPQSIQAALCNCGTVIELSAGPSRAISVMLSRREDAVAGDSTSPNYGASQGPDEKVPGWISADSHALGSAFDSNSEGFSFSGVV